MDDVKQWHIEAAVRPLCQVRGTVKFVDPLLIAEKSNTAPIAPTEASVELQEKITH